MNILKDTIHVLMEGKFLSLSNKKHFVKITFIVLEQFVLPYYLELILLDFVLLKLINLMKFV